MKKLCIFDLDGTLIDSISTIAHFGNIAVGSLGFEPVEIDKYKYFVGDGKKTLVHRMLAHYGADTPENFEKAERVYDENYEGNTLYKTTAYDGITALIKELKERGILIAVCSNKPDNVACSVVEKIFPDAFDMVLGLKDGANKKPAPDNALKIMEALNVKKEDSLFIGDTNVDIHTAKNAGVKSIGVLWGFRDEAELKEAGADVIVSHPSEILKYI